jgi:hypothetical protein
VLSVAFAETTTVWETVAPFAGAIIETVGCVVPPLLLVVYVSSLLSTELLLASVERTRKWYTVPAVKPTRAIWCVVTIVELTGELEPYAAVVP